MVTETARYGLLANPRSLFPFQINVYCGFTTIGAGYTKSMHGVDLLITTGRSHASGPGEERRMWWTLAPHASTVVCHSCIPLNLASASEQSYFTRHTAMYKLLAFTLKPLSIIVVLSFFLLTSRKLYKILQRRWTVIVLQLMYCFCTYEILHQWKCNHERRTLQVLEKKSSNDKCDVVVNCIIDVLVPLPI